MTINNMHSSRFQRVTPIAIGLLALVITLAFIPGEVLGDPVAGTNTIISNIKTIFKDLANLLVILLGVIIFLAAVFWVIQSISGWISKRLEMGEALLRVFIAIIGIMLMVWFLTEAETKVKAISSVAPIEIVSRIA